jgi:hypothetical protein
MEFNKKMVYNVITFIKFDEIIFLLDWMGQYGK